MRSSEALEKKIKIFKFLRIFNPTVMFGAVLFILLYVVDIPLVLAVSVACLTAAINFTVMNMVLRNLRNEQ